MSVVSRDVLSSLCSSKFLVGVLDVPDTVVEEPDVDEDCETELNSVGCLSGSRREGRFGVSTVEDHDADEENSLVEAVCCRVRNLSVSKDRRIGLSNGEKTHT